MFVCYICKKTNEMLDLINYILREYSDIIVWAIVLLVIFVIFISICLMSTFPNLDIEDPDFDKKLKQRLDEMTHPKFDKE